MTKVRSVRLDRVGTPLSRPGECKTVSCRRVALNLQRFYVALALAGVSGLAATPVQAAWDNVFQPACNTCRPKTSNYYAPPVVAGYQPAYVAQYAPPPVVANAPPASDCQSCTTRYVQRSYYQPVTTI